MRILTTKTMVLLTILLHMYANVNGQNKKEVTFPTADGINVTADLYLTNKKNATFIILFHQARYSRGEYIETAKKFNNLGYNCIAADLRSGGEANGIKNETHKQAQTKGLATKYANSLPDMNATIEYVFKNYPQSDVILLGSSYSASLVLVLATQYSNIIATIAFSPGEYFKLNDQTFKSFAPNVKCPIFITSAKKEIPMWIDIYNNLPTVLAFKFEPKEINGMHGSKNLWSSSPDNEHYWEEVKKFLNNL